MWKRWIPNAGIQCYSYHTASVFGKFRTRMNIGNEISQSVTIFANLEDGWLVLNNENVSYTCILADFAADLSGWERVFSLNRVTILCIKVGKIGFLGKKWLLGEKYFSRGKFAKGKTPIIGVTFLSKKKPCKHLYRNWLVVLGFNATLTAKIISWRLMTHMCFPAFSHQY